jgi:hypothetical protein
MYYRTVRISNSWMTLSPQMRTEYLSHLLALANLHADRLPNRAYLKRALLDACLGALGREQLGRLEDVFGGEDPCAVGNG